MYVQKLTKFAAFAHGIRSTRLSCVSNRNLSAKLDEHSAAKIDEHGKTPAHGHHEVSPERSVFVYKGKSYNYPWKGAWDEEFTPELWDRLNRVGAISPSGTLKPWKIKDPAERRMVTQMWIQRDDGRYIGNKLWHDQFVNRFVYVVMLATFISFCWGIYWSIVPKNENIFMYSNWKRWHHEDHH